MSGRTSARPRVLRLLTRARAGLVAAGALAACGDSPAESGSIAGAYEATTFRATPSGLPAVDVLAQGGALTVVIEADNRTIGTLRVPASLAGGSDFAANMGGTARRTGNTVRFEQSADSFVRDLAWTVSGNTLQVTDQAAGAARFTITLTRR